MPSIPSGWSSDKVKYLFTERIQKGYPDEPLLAATQTKGVVRKEMYENRTVTAQKDLHLLKLVEEGDFVISLRSFQGGIEFAHCRGIISPAYTVLKPKVSIDPRYFAYALKCKPFVDALSLYVTGIREGQNIDYTKFSRSELPVPPLEEQQKIVSFIQEQDRRIRKFIKNKRRLIALLEERKQAILDDALIGKVHNTNGANFIPFIGSIPNNWTSNRLKYLGRITSGFAFDSNDFTTKGVRVLKIANVGAGKINWTDECFLPEHFFDQYQRFAVHRDDLVFALTRPIISSGLKVALLGKGHGPVLLNQRNAIFRAKNNSLTRFLSHVMRCSYFREAFVNKIDFTGQQPNISPLDIGNILVALPADPNQLDEICDQIQSQSKTLQVAISRAETEIKLINEYRSRLIADGVTGKIDLRNFVLSGEAETPDTEPDLSFENSDELSEDYSEDEELLAEAANAN